MVSSVCYSVVVVNYEIFFSAEEGFFCQTTTSEERDLKQALADQSEVLNEDRSETSYLIDDTVDRYHALSLPCK